MTHDRIPLATNRLNSDKFGFCINRVLFRDRIGCIQDLLTGYNSHLGWIDSGVSMLIGCGSMGVAWLSVTKDTVLPRFRPIYWHALLSSISGLVFVCTRIWAADL